MRLPSADFESAPSTIPALRLMQLRLYYHTFFKIAIIFNQYFYEMYFELTIVDGLHLKEYEFKVLHDEFAIYNEKIIAIISKL